ncbi:hypothetical protein VTN96DRAFT_5199 [Rasamsonia emersonii]
MKLDSLSSGEMIVGPIDVAGVDHRNNTEQQCKGPAKYTQYKIDMISVQDYGGVFWKDHAGTTVITYPL